MVKFSLLGYVSIIGMIVVNLGISIIMEHHFLWPMRTFFVFVAARDVEFFFIHNHSHYPYVYWYVAVLLAVWESFIAARLFRLVTDSTSRTIERVLPAIVAASAIVNGKPGTSWFGEYPTTHMIFWLVGVLTLLILVTCAGVFHSCQERFNETSICFGIFMAAQIVACLHRLVVGISPIVWNLCWLVGVVCILHAVFSFHSELDPVTSTNG